ncbi:immunity protein Imm33 domain-containing protein [Anatilimnocola floriformis]|uniref:immunity protein Imm33 domain-containing protein n=1 Tax=Anatilimnocola floriformis TaxID=2948575 RepID=UPI0020C4D82F|nr:hypothetical protein [Anatilimnocola floriformis]
MQIVTTNCSRYHHAEFVLEAKHDYLQQTLQSVGTTIEQMVASGSRFKPNQTFQIGLSQTMVKPFDQWRLTLVEPDMVSFPIAWTSGISWTVQQLFLQSSCLGSVGLKPELQNVVLNKSLIVCRRYAEAGFLMHRSEPSDQNDSGWYLGCNDEGHNHDDPRNLERVSLYAALLRQPSIGAFLTFPFESEIQIDPQRGLRLSLHEQPIAIPPGTFLAEWFKRK